MKNQHDMIHLPHFRFIKLWHTQHGHVEYYGLRQFMSCYGIMHTSHSRDIFKDVLNKKKLSYLGWHLEKPDYKVLSNYSNGMNPYSDALTKEFFLEKDDIVYHCRSITKTAKKIDRSSTSLIKLVDGRQQKTHNGWRLFTGDPSAIDNVVDWTS